MKTKFSLFKYAGTLLLDQFLALLCSLVIVTILGFFLKNAGTLLQNILGFLFFAWIVYFDGWQKGSGDINKIKLGYIKKNYFKGVLAGLLASIPNIILATLAFLTERGSAVSFDLIGIDANVAIFRFWNMPLGIFIPLVNENPVYNFLIPVFLPVFSGIGYIFGLSRISIKQLVFYKNDDE